MTVPEDIWTVLGTERTADVFLIRRAYARRLKVTNPEDDAEAFGRLRAAYEQALALAHASARAAPAQAQPGTEEPADPVPSVPPRNRTAVEQLQDRFQLLDEATRDPACDEPRLRELFAACLTSPALDNVQAQLLFERAVAHWLLARRPASDSLFGDAAARFDWEQREGAVGVAPDIAAAIRQLRDLQFWNLEQGSVGTRARAHKALLTRPNPAWLRLEMALFNLDKHVQILLLEIVNHHRSLVAKLDAGAVAWWQEYFTRPRLSMEWLRLLIALVPLAGVGAAIADGQNHAGAAAVKGALGALLAIALILIFKLYAIDWQRQRLSRRKKQSPTWMRIGWFPAAMGAFALSALLPGSPWSVCVAVLAAALCIAWVSIIANIPGMGGQSLDRLVRNGLLINAPAVVCWLLVALDDPQGPPLAMWPTFISLLVAERIGTAVLFGEYKYGISAPGRKFVLVSIVALAILAVYLAFASPMHAPWIGLNSVLLFTVVICARTPAILLSHAQNRARYFLMYLPAIGIFQAVLNKNGKADLFDLLSMTHIIQVIAVWLMTGVILALCMVGFNEWTSRAVEET
jgi:hypothetical protein